MKNLLLTGSPSLMYKKSPRIPTNMTAIIRRYRFVILIVIVFLILMIFTWHFHRKAKSISHSAQVSHFHEHFIDEYQSFELNKKYFYEITKMHNTEDGDKPQLINIKNLPEQDNDFPFVPKKIGKEKTRYQVEEHFIPEELLKNEFTDKVIRHLEDQFTIGDEAAFTAPIKWHLEKQSSLPSDIGMLADAKHLHLRKYATTLPNANKPVKFSTIQQQVEFPPPNQEHATLSMARNKSGTMNLLDASRYIIQKQLESSQTKSDIRSTSKETALLIDTPGCKIPRLDPWDPTVKDLIELQEPYVCPGPPVFMKSNPGGSITYNKTILEMYYNITAKDLICYYQPIYRTYEEGDTHRENSYETGNVTKLEFGVPLNEDYVSVSCNINGELHTQYFPLVRLKYDVEAERTSIVNPNSKLNVILLGIDSISKLNFLRHFPRTHSFLKEKLRPFEMNGYTKVADNTFPNLVPMLTGQFVEYWWNETVKNTMFFDNIGLVWKEYAKRGYRTFYAEDNPLAGTFNYLKRGFHNAPTDYYFRPLALALETWKTLKKPIKQFCLNSQLDFELMYNYLKDFAQTMDSRPYFGFVMTSTVTHDKLNNAGWTDEPTVHLLEDLLNTGVLNNTVLVLFSDHGIRFGKIRHTYIGKFEERLPLMYIHVPKWFLTQHPEIAKNLHTNQDRLMTLLDLHATIIHLLDLRKTQEERSHASLGRSLFEEISPNRTCQDAYIQTHWCPCQLFSIVDSNSTEAINASQAIVEDINSKLKPYDNVCEILELDTILDARVGKANELLVEYLRSENEVINKTIYIGDKVTPLDDYMVTLVTKPGGGVFEATVRHNPDGNRYSVLGLSRISMYGTTSWCVDSQKLKLFCYCKIQ